MRSKKQRYDEIGRFADEELHASVVILAEKFLQDFPNNRSVWLTYSLSLRFLNRFEEAKKSLSKALDLSDETDEIYCWLLCNMGQIYKSAGNYKEAIKWFNKAHGQNPNEATFLIYKGTLLFRLGKFNKAKRTLKKAIQCGEGQIDEAFYNLGAVLLSQGKYAYASECFQKALEIDPEYEEAKLLLKDSRNAMKL